MYTVAGGGLAGLVAAARITAAGHPVRVFEPGDEVGGRARTYDTAGDPVERFPEYLIGSNESIRDVLSAHGVADRLLRRRGRTARYHGGIVHPVDAPWEQLAYPGLGLRNTLRLRRLERALAEPNDESDDSPISPIGEGRTVEAAVTGRAGADLYAGWFEPLVRAGFGDYAGEVPEAWLHEWVESRADHGRGGESVGYLDGSLGTLVAALVDQVGDDVIRHDARIVDVEPSTDDSLSTDDSPSTGKRDRSIAAIVEDDSGARRVETDGVVIATDPTDLERVAGVDTGLDVVSETCALVTAEESLTDAWRLVFDASDDSVDDAPFDAVIEHTNLISSDRYGDEHLLYLVRCGRSGVEPDRVDGEQLRDRWLAALSDRFPGFSEDTVRSIRVARDPAAAVVPATGASRSRTIAVDLADFGVPGVAYAGPGTPVDRFGTAVSTRIAAGVAAAAAVLPD